MFNKRNYPDFLLPSNVVEMEESLIAKLMTEHEIAHADTVAQMARRQKMYAIAEDATANRLVIDSMAQMDGGFGSMIHPPFVNCSFHAAESLHDQLKREMDNLQLRIYNGFAWAIEASRAAARGSLHITGYHSQFPAAPVIPYGKFAYFDPKWQKTMRVECYMVCGKFREDYVTLSDPKGKKAKKSRGVMAPADMIYVINGETSIKLWELEVHRHSGNKEWKKFIAAAMDANCHRKLSKHNEWLGYDAKLIRITRTPHAATFQSYSPNPYLDRSERIYYKGRSLGKSIGGSNEWYEQAELPHAVMLPRHFAKWNILRDHLKRIQDNPINYWHQRINLHNNTLWRA